jgi:hypothetical protein
VLGAVQQRRELSRAFVSEQTRGLTGMARLCRILHCLTGAHREHVRRTGNETPGPRPGETMGCRAGTQGCTLDSAAYIKPGRAASAGPWSMTQIRSASRSASSRYCVVSSSVVPPATRSVIIAQRASLLAGQVKAGQLSVPEDGSKLRVLVNASRKQLFPLSSLPAHAEVIDTDITPGAAHRCHELATLLRAVHAAVLYVPGLGQCAHRAAARRRTARPTGHRGSHRR